MAPERASDRRPGLSDGEPPADGRPDDNRPSGSDDPARETSHAESYQEDGEEEAYTSPSDGAPPNDKGADEEDVSDILGTDTIFRRILATADDEFDKAARLLFLSGIAAGLIMSLSFMGLASVKARVPADSTGLVPSMLYPLGFLFVVLGRYQLFTENTLTPVSLVLARLASIPRLLRIWGIVFTANIIGSALAAYYYASTGIFGPETVAAATGIGEHMLEMSWADTFFKGTIAGWLVAGMVWLNHASREAAARVLIVFFLMYVVSVADLAHCIVGSSEMLYLVFRGGASFWGDFLWGFLAPAALGNTAGGVLLVALLNYGLTREKRLPDRDRISWRELFMGEREHTPEQSISEEGHARKQAEQKAQQRQKTPQGREL